MRTDLAADVFEDFSIISLQPDAIHSTICGLALAVSNERCVTPLEGT